MTGFLLTGFTMRAARALALSATALAASALPGSALAQQKSLNDVSHIVVLYLENRSFDNIFGEFPGADGIANAIASNKAGQRDHNGAFYKTLPAPHGKGAFDVSDNPDAVRKSPWPELPNAPFAIDKLIPGNHGVIQTRDLVHRFYTDRAQINGGANDRYVAYSDAGGLAMGYYSKAAMENSILWKLARENTLLDKFFMGAFGGSFLNHLYLVCACAPAWPNPPEGQRSRIDAKGDPLPDPKRPGDYEDNRVTAAADGDIAINTVQSVFLNNGNQKGVVLPAQTQPTIGDRLTARNVDWAWYSGGFNLATKEGRSEQETNMLQESIRFQWHHQAFAYFDRFNPGTEKGKAERAAHLRDAETLVTDITTGKLPPVTFYKPSGLLNQHPGYANLDAGDAEVGRIVDALKAGPMKDSFVLVITYDENGGFYDHAAPPAGAAAGARADFLGPGTRVPTLIVSPLAKKGIDSTEYDTSSILKLITERFALEPLPSPRVQAVNSLSLSLDVKR